MCFTSDSQTMKLSGAIVNAREERDMRCLRLHVKIRGDSGYVFSRSVELSPLAHCPDFRDALVSFCFVSLSEDLRPCPWTSTPQYFNPLNPFRTSEFSQTWAFSQAMVLCFAQATVVFQNHTLFLIFLEKKFLV